MSTEKPNSVIFFHNKAEKYLSKLLQHGSLPVHPSKNYHPEFPATTSYLNHNAAKLASNSPSSSSDYSEKSSNYNQFFFAQTEHFDQRLTESADRLGNAPAILQRSGKKYDEGDSHPQE